MFGRLLGVCVCLCVWERITKTCTCGFDLLFFSERERQCRLRMETRRIVESSNTYFILFVFFFFFDSVILIHRYTHRHTPTMTAKRSARNNNNNKMKEMNNSYAFGKKEKKTFLFCFESCVSVYHSCIPVEIVRWIYTWWSGPRHRVHVSDGISLLILFSFIRCWLVYTLRIQQNSNVFVCVSVMAHGLNAWNIAVIHMTIVGTLKFFVLFFTFVRSSDRPPSNREKQRIDPQKEKKQKKLNWNWKRIESNARIVSDSFQHIYRTENKIKIECDYDVWVRFVLFVVVDIMFMCVCDLELVPCSMHIATTDNRLTCCLFALRHTHTQFPPLLERQHKMQLNGKSIWFKSLPHCRRFVVHFDCVFGSTTRVR